MLIALSINRSIVWIVNIQKIVRDATTVAQTTKLHLHNAFFVQQSKPQNYQELLEIIVYTFICHYRIKHNMSDHKYFRSIKSVNSPVISYCSLWIFKSIYSFIVPQLSYNRTYK